MAEIKQGSVDISRYTELKARGSMSIFKPAPDSKNFVLYKANYSPDSKEEVEPTTANINRGSLTEIRAGIAKRIEELNAAVASAQALYAQVDAIEADMDALEGVGK